MKLNLQNAILICCCCMFSLFSTYGQYNRPENQNWTLTNKYAFNFNTPSPTVTKPSFGGFGTPYATASNSKGELLFFTNGDKVWDKNGTLMPSGDLKLFFGATGLEESTFATDQGVLIVPIPGDKDKYYVFSTTYGMFFFMLPGATYYSIIDMSLNQGLGDVSSPPLLLEAYDGNVADKMIAIPGNDCNVWVLKGQVDSSNYKAFEINESGLKISPVYTKSTKEIAFWGVLAVSPNGKKVAAANANSPELGKSADEGLVISDFDATTGKITNSFYLDSTFSYRGVCFSPDNSKVYASAWHQGDPLKPESGLFQFDLTATNPAATKTRIASGRILGMQVAPNDKVYVSNETIGIGVISAPNAAGVACQYTVEYKADSIKGAIFFQNTIMFPHVEPTITSEQTVLCNADSGLLINAKIIDTAYTYLWNTGDEGSGITVHAEDTYIVTYGDHCNQFVDTFVVTTSELFTTITVSGNILSTSGGPFTDYQWHLDGQPISGATNATYTVTQNGAYSVKVTDETGCEYLSDPYTINNQTSINEFSNDNIRIYPNPSKDVVNIHSPVAVNITIKSIEGKSLIAEQGVNAVNVSTLPQGVYLLQVSNQEGELLKTERIIKQ